MCFGEFLEMKIWIDLTNSPHVNFFARMISDLQKEHEILLTSRPLANTIELLELHGFDYHLVGKHYGKNIVKKVLGFFVRAWQLFALLRRENIDVAISHSSFFSPLVAKYKEQKNVSGIEEALNLVSRWTSSLCIPMLFGIMAFYPDIPFRKM